MDLRLKVRAGAEKLGYQDADADIITEVLLYAQMRGNNQGIAKIATGGVPAVADIEPFSVVREHKCGVLLSGGQAMVSTVRGVEKSIDLAREHGVGVVAVNHTHTSSGAIGYYVRRIAREGFIGFLTVGNGDWAAVAPAGSSEAKLGTNPLAYAFPYDGGEVVFDTATAAIAYYGLVEAKLKGELLPEGVALDKTGQLTRNASDVLSDGVGEAMRGAIVTFAGHKGFGLSLLVQLLGSAFSRAGFPGGYGEDGGGTFILALDPGLLASTEEYMKRSRELVESIKSARPIPGQEILMPGERGDDRARQVEQSGEIDVAEPVWNELLKFVG